MTKWILAAWLLAVAAVFACSPFAAAQSEGGVKIISAIPAGDLSGADQAQQIVVVFDRPMVPLGALPEGAGSGPLALDPAVAGKYRWLGTTRIAFIPDQQLPLATAFSASVPAGVKALDGTELAEDYYWTFTTLRPDIDSHYPYNSQHQVDVTAPMTIVFNQPVDPAALARFVHLKLASSQRETRTRISRPAEDLWKRDWEGTDIRRAIAIHPQSPLATGQDYVLSLDAGLPGMEGPLGLERPWTIQFRTINEFKFVALTPSSPVAPDGMLTFLFTNKIPPKNLVGKLRIDPPAAIPEYYFSDDYARYDDETGGEVMIWLPLKPQQSYTLTLAADLEDAFGNTLGAPIALSLDTGDYGPWIYVPDEMAIVESYGQRRHPLEFVNLDQVQLRMCLVPPEKAVPLLTTDCLFCVSNKLRLESLGLKWNVNRDWFLDGKRNERNLLPIELSEALGANKRTGLIFFELAAPQVDYPKMTRGFLQVTSLGVTGKFSAEKNMIFVSNLRDASPVNGASVELRDRDNKIVWSGKTDAAGIAETPGWRKLGISSDSSWSQPLQWAIVRQGSDAAVISSELGTGVYPWRFNIDYNWGGDREQASGSVFTDRGIYRDNETIHLKGVFRVKEGTDWAIPAGYTARLVISDPQADDVLSEEIRLSAHGSFAYDWTLDPKLKKGVYTIEASIIDPTADGDGAKILGRATGSFRFAAFRPAQYEVKVETSGEDYVSGDTLTATIDGHYLFGAPMAGQPADYSLTWTPFDFQPPGHEAFSFMPYSETYDDYGYDEERSGKHVASGSGILDNTGILNVSLPLNVEETTAGALTLEASVQGLDRQRTSGRRDVRLHPGAFYIGLRAGETLATVGTPAAIDVIAVDFQGELVPAVPVSITIIHRQWNSVRQAGVAGRYSWTVETQDTDKWNGTVTTGADPEPFNFTPDTAGFYIISAEAKDSAGRVIKSGTTLYACGEGYAAWARSDDDRIDLVADADRYKPGDTAHILIKSPYEQCRALITLERETILEHKMIELTGTTPTIEIPVTSAHLPNVFVSVILLQGRTSTEFSPKGEDLGKPSFKIGYINLPVSPDERRLTVNLSLPKTDYQPGDKVSLDIAVAGVDGRGVPNAEVTVAAVDLGILNLIGYNTPDLFPYFYGQRSLCVATAEIRQHVIGERNYGQKGQNRGGGGGFTSDVRTRFEACAYWNPALITDANGRIHVEFTLPDNLTSFRIMAIGHSQDSRFGSGDARIAVNKPLMLRPVLPRFARVGDTFDAGVVVHNNSKNKEKIKLEGTGSGIKMGKLAEKSVTIEPGKAARVTAPCQVPATGEGQFTFNAQTKKLSDGVQLSIPLTLPMAPEWVATSGSTDGTTREMLDIPQNVLPDYSQVSVSASSTALVGLRDVSEYLFGYPYGCLEQHLSRVLPMILFGDVVDAFQLNALEGKDYRHVVRDFLGQLGQWECPDGGMAYWAGSERDSPYVSALAFFALLRAKDAGYPIEEGLKDRLHTYIDRLLRGNTWGVTYPYNDRCWNSFNAFAVALLAQDGDPQPAYIERLYRQRQNLPLTALAHLYIAIGPKGDAVMRSEIKRMIENHLKESSTSAHFEEPDSAGLEWIFYSHTQATAAVLQALLQVDGQHPRAEYIVRYLLAARKDGLFRNTYESFWAFYALAQYYQTYEAAEPNFQAQITLAGKDILDRMFHGRSLDTVTAVRTVAETGTGALPVNVTMTGTGRLYYTLRMATQSSGPAPARAEGFSIERVYLTKNGQPAAQLKAGETYTVVLTISTPQDRTFVIVDDPLPAGVEPVQTTFLTESQELTRQLWAGREDGSADFWWGGFDRTELHDDRVLATADYLLSGSHEVRYLVRATVTGKFSAPGATVLQMYEPEVFARTASELREVK